MNNEYGNNGTAKNNGYQPNETEKRGYQPNPGQFGYQPVNKNTTPPSPPKSDTNASKSKSIKRDLLFGIYFEGL